MEKAAPASARFPPRPALVTAGALAVLTAAALLLEARLGIGPWLDDRHLSKSAAAGRATFFLTSTFEGASLAWLVLAWYAGGGDGRRAARTIAALILAGLLGWAFKETVVRERPNTADLNSFPSGHVAGAAAVAAGLWSRRVAGNVLLVLGVALGAFTRIATAKHFPSDVLGGALLGLLCAWVGMRLPIPYRARPTRTQILLFLLAAILAASWLSERNRDFFAGTAPGIWLLVAAVALAPGTGRAAAVGRSPA